MLERDQIHCGRADEARGKAACRAGIHFARRRALLHAALVQQHHLVGHAHGFGLVMGHIDHREAQALLQFAQLAAHFLAQLGVEIGKGFVHQADLGLGDQRAPQRHALLLSAGQLRGPAIKQGRKAQQLGGFGQATRGFGRGHLAHRQPEAYVLRHREVGKQRIVLEHHGDAALGGRQMADFAAVDAHTARGRGFQPGNDAQGG